MTGEAFAGRVVAVEPDRVSGGAKRRVLRPWITVATADPVLVLPGTVLTSPARRGQRAQVVSVTGAGGPGGGNPATFEEANGADGPNLVVLELSGGMGRSLVATPGSVPEPGEWVCYSTLTDEYLPIAEFPSPDQTPWTHGGPPVPYEPVAEDAVEDWS